VRDFLKPFPWQVRVPLRIAFARWRGKKGGATEAAMRKPEYALSVFRRHFERFPSSMRRENLVALELGPGDSLFSALIAYAFGFRKTYLVDTRGIASRDFSEYRKMIAYLAGQGLNVEGLEGCTNLDELLTQARCEYLTEGLAALRGIPSETVDFSWSQAVLEHVRKKDFRDIFVELKRIHRLGGVSSHRVDLSDHIEDSLNNLRFEEAFWEATAGRTSGLYTNRMRLPAMLRLFEEIGFTVEGVQVERWPTLPTARENFAPEFRVFTDEQLNVSSFDVVLSLPSTSARSAR